MGIWIRSQNKEDIVNTKAIYYTSAFILKDGAKGGNYIIGMADEAEVLLGEYSTKEKALSVLDAIQECIVENKENWLHSQFNEPIEDPRKTFVFQMLRDEEVKVRQEERYGKI